MAGVQEQAGRARSIYLRGPVLRLLLIALLAETGYATLNISTMPVYLLYDRGFGTAVIGLVLVAFLLCEAIFKSPMGALADRFGRKRLLVFGPFLTVFTSLATVLVPHGAGFLEGALLVLLRAMDGLGAAMIWPAAFALMGDMVEDRDRQQSMSLLNMCYLVGVGLALPFGGWANDLIGPYLPELFQRSPGLFLSATLFAVVAGAAWFTIPADRPDHEHHEHHGEVGLRELRNALRRIPQYMLLASITFMGIGFPMAIIKIFALEQFAMSESQFGALVLPAVGAMAVFSVPMARLGDRMGRYRAVHVGLFLCVAGLTLISLGALFPAFRAPWAFALGGLPVGFGFLLTIPAWMTSVSEIDPKKRGSSLGAVMTAQGVGAIVGAPIGALLYDRLQPVGQFLGLGADFGRYSPFVGCTACVTAGWLLSLRILQESSHRSAAASVDATARIVKPPG